MGAVSGAEDLSSDIALRWLRVWARTAVDGVGALVVPAANCAGRARDFTARRVRDAHVVRAANVTLRRAGAVCK